MYMYTVLINTVISNVHCWINNIIHSMFYLCLINKPYWYISAPHIMSILPYLKLFTSDFYVKLMMHVSRIIFFRLFEKLLWTKRFMLWFCVSVRYVDCLISYSTCIIYIWLYVVHTHVCLNVSYRMCISCMFMYYSMTGLSIWPCLYIMSGQHLVNVTVLFIWPCLCIMSGELLVNITVLFIWACLFIMSGVLLVNTTVCCSYERVCLSCQVYFL